MGMLTYKQYKLLHENFDSVIGLSRPTTVGLQSEAPQLFGMMSKMAKRMPGNGPPDLKKKPGMGDESPDMGGDADMDMDHPDVDDDMGDGEGDGEGDEHPDMDADADSDMGDDDDMGDEEGDGEGDGEGEMGDMGPMGAGSPPPGMGGPMGGDEMGGPLGGPMKGKKPMPPKMMAKKMSMGGMSNPSMNYMRKEAADPQDAKMKSQNKKNKVNDQNDAGPGPASKKTTTVREEKCCDKCGNMMSKKCSKSSKMTAEQREFNNSLMRQAGSLKFHQDEYGYWVPVTEDVLIQQKPETNHEPQAGEAGFAPQAKIGVVGSNFQEWASRHQVKNKK